MVIDWSTFIPDNIASFLGSLIGFGLALIGERLVDNHKTQSDIKEIKELLREELIECKNSLTKLDVNALDVQPIKVTSWEGISHTYQLSLLDVNSRRQLFRVYDLIIELNSWSLVHTNYYFEKEIRNELLVNEIAHLKNTLLTSGKENKKSIIDEAISCLS